METQVEPKKEKESKGIESPKKAQEQKATAKKPEQKYFIIQLPTARPEIGDPPRVPVNTPNYKSPQGMKRNTPLPVPAEVIEALDHSKYTKWDNVEGENRKVGEPRHRFPYSLLCEISPKGYQVLREKALKEEISEQDYLPYKI